MAATPVDPEPLDPTLRFEAVPYRAKGGYTLPGLLVTLLFTLVGGIVAGVLAGWLGQWFYLIVVFPIVIAVIVGGCGALGASWGKLTSPRVGLLVGISGGCLAMAVMHYFQFLTFLAEVDKVVPGALDLRFSLIAFSQFIDQSAVEGVQIVSRPGKAAMNLGYYGSYI